MPSLASLVAAHSPLLVIDSAAGVQAGLWRRNCAPIWRQSQREAGVAVFECVDGLLVDAGIGVNDLGVMAFCEGPGSILGIRMAAIALRTWQAVAAKALPTFGYRSLELVAHDLKSSGTRMPFAVIADARRDTWHCVEIGNGESFPAVRRVPRSFVADFPGELFTPTGFRVWSQPPREIREVPYLLGALWDRQIEADLFRAVSEPDAFLHQESVYAAWSPQIHRAPG